MSGPPDTVRIELLVVPDCPSRTVALDRITLALAIAGCTDAQVIEHFVTSAEEANRVGLRGSPTILVDGHDVLAVPEEPTSLSCRLYPTDDRLDVVPSIDQLVAAFTRQTPQYAVLPLIVDQH